MAISDPFSTTYEGARQGLGTIGEAILGVAGLYAKQKQREREMQMEEASKSKLLEKQYKLKQQFPEPKETAETEYYKARTEQEKVITEGLKRGATLNYINKSTGLESNRADPDAISILVTPTATGNKYDIVDETVNLQKYLCELNKIHEQQIKERGKIGAFLGLKGRGQEETEKQVQALTNILGKKFGLTKQIPTTTPPIIPSYNFKTGETRNIGDFIYKRGSDGKWYKQ